jgi:hypothetical protein
MINYSSKDHITTTQFIFIIISLFLSFFIAFLLSIEHSGSKILINANYYFIFISLILIFIYTLFIYIATELCKINLKSF